MPHSEMPGGYVVRPKKQIMLALIMLVSVILWGSFMMGWFEGVEVYLLPPLIVLWLFFIMQWTKRS